MVIIRAKGSVSSLKLSNEKINKHTTPTEKPIIELNIIFKVPLSFHYFQILFHKQED